MLMPFLDYRHGIHRVCLIGGISCRVRSAIALNPHRPGEDPGWRPQEVTSSRALTQPQSAFHSIFLAPLRPQPVVVDKASLDYTLKYLIDGNNPSNAVVRVDAVVQTSAPLSVRTSQPWVYKNDSSVIAWLQNCYFFHFCVSQKWQNCHFRICFLGYNWENVSHSFTMKKAPYEIPWILVHSWQIRLLSLW